MRWVVCGSSWSPAEEVTSDMKFTDTYHYWLVTSCAGLQEQEPQTAQVETDLLEYNIRVVTSDKKLVMCGISLNNVLSDWFSTPRRQHLRVGIYHINYRFHTILVVWNLGVTHDNFKSLHTGSTVHISQWNRQRPKNSQTTNCSAAVAQLLKTCRHFKLVMGIWPGQTDMLPRVYFKIKMALNNQSTVPVCKMHSD